MDIVDLPLHGGHAPRWLYQRMVRLSSAILKVIDEIYGKKEILARFSDALWFQAFSCAIGFDWHSSGSTTVTTSAVKDALSEADLGIYAVGGKRTARKVPDEISKLEDLGYINSKIADRLIRYSKYSAKANTIALLDGYDLYHHFLLFDEKGNYVVIEQGMRDKFARRYHIYNKKDFVEEVNSSIASIKREVDVYDYTARESREARKAAIDALSEIPRLFTLVKKQATLDMFTHKGNEINFYKMPASHRFSSKIYETLLRAYEQAPSKFEELYDTSIGPKSMRALTLIAELIFKPEIARKDPVKYTFAHGGKDGVPYPVDRKTYDNTIRTLEEAIKNADLGNKEKLLALKRLSDKFNYGGD